MLLQAARLPDPLHFPVRKDPVFRREKLEVVGRGHGHAVGPGIVDEEAVWTRDCRVDEVTDIAMVDGVALVRATGVIG